MQNLPKIDNWFNLIKEITNDFSDLNFQKKAFNGEDGLWSSPIELYAIAFDDYHLDVWFDVFKNKLPRILRADMEHFIQKLDDVPTYDENHTTVDSILYSPEWVELRNIAAALYQQLQALPEDEFNISV